MPSRSRCPNARSMRSPRSTGRPSRVRRLTQPELAKKPHPPAELMRFGHSAVIVVNPTRTLEVRTGVNLVPLPDGRAIISFDQPFTAADFELMIADALDDRRLSRSDQAIFRTIAQILRAAALEGRHASAEHHRARVPAASPARHVETFDCALPAHRVPV